MTKPRRRTHARILAELDAAEGLTLQVPRFAEPGRTLAELTRSIGRRPAAVPDAATRAELSDRVDPEPC